MTDVGGPFVLRNPARKASNVLWLLLIAVSVYLIITRPDTSDRMKAAVAGVVFLVLLAVNLRSGVRCDRDGVVAIDEIRRRRIPWIDIDHFEQRGLRGIGAVKRSGRWVRLTGYATLGDVSQGKATALLEGQRLKFQAQGSSDADGMT